jgi:uncharacterized protein
VTGGPPRYSLTAAQFNGLAGGYGDDGALAVLSSAQFSKRLLLLQWIRAEHPTPEHAEAWSLLDEATTRHPAARDVLGHPFVGTWAARYLREQSSAGREHRYLIALAAAVGVAAGLDFEVRMPVQPGEVILPGLGLAYGLGQGTATVRHDAGILTIAGPDRVVVFPVREAADRPHWCPYRQVRAGEAHAVFVDDLDPYRTCFRLTLTARLRPDEHERLQVTFAEAAQLIDSGYPDYRPTIRHCLRSLVPLAAPGPGSISATAHSAFGAIATSIPDGPGLAHLLIHEAQHSKLDALLDLVDLVDPADTSVYHAPWRADPRPLTALLHGAYAHTGVVDFWRIRQNHVDGEAARIARFEFAYWLEQTRRAVATLAEAKGLTELGTRFVGHLGGTLDALRNGQLDEVIAAGVEELATAVATGWRLRHHRVRDDELRQVIHHWRSGQECPVISPAPVAADPAGGPARLDGIAARLRHELVNTPDGDSSASATTLRHNEALSVAIDRDDPEAWAGLALALARCGSPTAARVVAERPELMRAMLAELRPDTDPVAVAGWLAGGLP